MDVTSVEVQRLHGQELTSLVLDLLLLALNFGKLPELMVTKLVRKQVTLIKALLLYTQHKLTIEHLMAIGITTILLTGYHLLRKDGTVRFTENSIFQTSQYFKILKSLQKLCTPTLRVK